MDSTDPRRLRTTGPSLDEDEFVNPTGQAEVHVVAHAQLPEDARAMGLSEWTAPGLTMVTSLANASDRRRRRARIVAWVVLVLAAGPMVLSLFSTLVGQ